MANLNYYAHEIDRQLRQVSVNEIDIGMRRVNVLPVPDGELTIEQSDLPSSADLTVIGDTANGSITVSLSGEAEVPPTITVLVGCGKLTPRGNGPGATGTLIPGTYSVTLGGSESAASMPWDEYKPPMLYINVGTSEGATSYSTDYDGETTDIVVPDNYTEVEFTLYLYIDSFDEAASCQFYPFLRLKVLEDEPFEPYKPDLQTQINALPQAENVARLTDAVGTDGSINLFPIDKGKNGEPFEYERINGSFYINSEGFFNIGEKIGRMAFEGTSDGTTEDVDEFRVFFNIGYKDTAYEFGDLVRGKYALSYEIDDDTDFTDNGEIYFEVYGFSTSTSNETLLTTVHAGETKTFEVTEENPRIEIKVIAHRFSSHSWNGSSIIFTPYLRRAEYADKDVDKYQPSLQKQIVVNDAKIRSELQNYENSNNNYLMPTFSGELPVEVDGGVGGYCDEWAIYGNSDGVGERTPNLHTFNSDTKTDAGVEFVADGKTGTVTATGATTATSSVISVSSTQPFQAGTYEFTCDSDATDATYYSYVRVTGSSTTIASDRAGASVSGQFTLAEASYLTIYHRMAAQSGNYHVFKPMICKVGETPTNFIAYGYQVPLINVNEYASEEIYDPTDTDTSNGYIADKYLDANGTAQASSDYIVTEYYAFTDRKGLTVWRGSIGAATSACICFYDSSKNFLGSKGYADDKAVCIFYPPKDTVYIRASIDKSFKDSAKIFAYPSHSYTVYVGKEPLTEGKTVNQDSFEYSDNEFVLRARDTSGFALNKFDTSLDNKPKCDFTVDRLKNIENSIIEANVVVNGYNETQVDRITDNVREVTT